MPLSDLGELIWRDRDDHGEVHVYQRDGYRYLTLGNAVEQSCLELACPSRLVHVYTQAMMLALLLREAAGRALLLGLGGGSLAHALRAALPDMHIVALEQRAAVVRVARSHFGLPDDGHLHLVYGDAAGRLATDPTRYDLIFADLYLAEGMHPDQLTHQFLTRCRTRLTPQGIVVINQWSSEYQVNHAANELLRDVFSDNVLHLCVQGGNIVSFAFHDELPNLDRKRLFTRAQRLGVRLDIPLQRHARSLWWQNAETLRLRRQRR